MKDEYDIDNLNPRRNPYAYSIKTVLEVEDMKQHPDKYKGYDDVDEMMNEILNEETADVIDDIENDN